MNDSNLEVPQSSLFHSNAVFFVEIDKVKPNPYQPRKEFDEYALNALAESIRMYGVLQPMTVCRKEVVHENGGMSVEYELVAGERRLRASKIAGLREVPVLIRATEDDDRVKLELAIIENLQREDLTPVDRARAFHQLSDEFGFKHTQIAKKVGKSREYVSNSIRLLALPEEILQAITDGKITEGHARPLMMLNDRPEEQVVLFKEIMLKKMTVRDAEKISRRVAHDKVRKKDPIVAPDIVELEHEVSDVLGTRVQIEQKAEGGRIYIDYFNQDDLRKILLAMKHESDTDSSGNGSDENHELNTEELIGSAGIQIQKKEEIKDVTGDDNEEVKDMEEDDNEKIQVTVENDSNTQVQSFAQTIHTTPLPESFDAPLNEPVQSDQQDSLSQNITDYITGKTQPDPYNFGENVAHDQSSDDALYSTDTLKT